MFIILKKNCSQEELDSIVRKIENMGCEAIPVVGKRRTAIAVTGNEDSIDPGFFEVMPGVERAHQITKPYRMVTRDYRNADTVIELENLKIGGCGLTVIAGPCAVESEKQALRIAGLVKNGGAHIFRGGAFKPRSSPYSFQGLGEKGLKILKKVREEFDIPVITEALDARSLELAAEYADIIQIGTRNMQNYSLLKEVGKVNKPVMLKRGMAASAEEFLMSAEYLMSEGNDRIILCERGVRSPSSNLKGILDLNIVLTVKKMSHLPVFIDPSHAAGRRDRVVPLARAGVAVGVHGVMVEVHDDPENAYSDGPQSLPPGQFEKLIHEIGKMKEILGFYE